MLCIFLTFIVMLLLSHHWADLSPSEHFCANLWFTWLLYITMLSAYILIFLLRMSGTISFKNIINIRELSTDPCGTPDFTCLLVELIPSISVYCCLCIHTLKILYYPPFLTSACWHHLYVSTSHWSLSRTISDFASFIHLVMLSLNLLAFSQKWSWPVCL